LDTDRKCDSIAVGRTVVGGRRLGVGGIKIRSDAASGRK
jgi:hypothetical protein